MECLVIYKFKNKFYCYEDLVILTDIDIDTISTLLITCIMIIKLSHYI